jgi:starvation-inducible outer membrane lipoprotein
MLMVAWLLPAAAAAAPTVTLTAPLSGITGVPLNQALTATFSEAMDQGTLIGANFTVSGPGSIAGTVTKTSTSMTFTPTSPLAIDTLITATITTGVKNLAGDALASNYVWTFTTGTSPESTAPTVSATSPLPGANLVEVNRQITATFSEPMDPTSVNEATFNVAVTVAAPGTSPVAGTVTHLGSVFTFHLDGGLSHNTLYTVTITTGAKDLAGNAMASDYSWSFTTGSAPDVTAPTVSTTSPLPRAIGVAVNKQIAATFSEYMDPATVTTANVTVTGPGSTPVAGTITNIGPVFTFHPSSGLLASNALHTVKITTGVRDLGGNALTSSYSWTFTTGSEHDVTAPTVSSTEPLAGATEVAVNKQIAATFSEFMDPASMTTANVTVTGPGSTPVAGTITNIARVLTFHPSSGPLAGNTLYTVTIKPGVTDLAFNALANNYVWTFTTGSAADVTAPTVSSTDPLPAATGVAVNKQIAATFSESMDPTTVTTANVTVTGPGSTPVAGTITNVGAVFTFHPINGALAANTLHTVTITSAVKDLADNAQADNYVWTFTTGSAIDVTAPTVSSADPLAGATGVAVNKQIAATFSESMDPATVTTANVTVTGPGSTPVEGTITNVGAVFTFHPISGALAANTLHTVTITRGVKDLADNALADNYVWTFTTGSASDVTAPTVSYTDPGAGVAGVAFNKQIAATFSEPMDPATVTTATVRVTGPSNRIVLGTVTNVGAIFTFHPKEGSLIANGQFLVTITTGAKDLAGNALAANYSWTFVTGSTPDAKVPTVSSTDPPAGATEVAINKQIAATFSESMDPTTVTTATVRVTGPNTRVVLGTVTNVGTVFTFHPNDGTLIANTQFVVTITTGAKDLAGNALAGSHAWTFTTGSAPDVTAPTISSTDPAAGATGVAISKQIVANFSEAMDPATMSTAFFSVTDPGGNPVAGTVVYLGSAATFHPITMLLGNTRYTAEIAPGVRDLAFNSLAVAQATSWTFTTGLDPSTAVADLDGIGVPQAFALEPNYPNPFNPSTTIAYQLPVPSAVRLEIYDMLGQRVRTLVAQEQSAGFYRAVWDSRNEAGMPAATGMYFYRLEAEEFVQVRRLMLIK